MSTENPANAATTPEAYQKAWWESIEAVLGQLAGSPFTPEKLPAAEAAAAVAALAETGVCLVFAADKRVRGEQAFLLSAQDALGLAQVLMGEPPGESAELTPEYRDALAELFRQFAGSAATALKGPLGGEVAFPLVGSDRRPWTPGAQAAVRFTHPSRPHFLLCFLLSKELEASLQSVSGAVAASTAAPPAGMSQPSPASWKSETNLDLLLDVELEATLRFGERSMILRDILELGPGSVVELDRQVQEPVELLVGDKVIARGEVVIVDGNYGLRVTEIVSPRQRLVSLETQGFAAEKRTG